MINTKIYKIKKTQLTNIGNETKDITIDSVAIKRIITNNFTLINLEKLRCNNPQQNFSKSYRAMTKWDLVWKCNTISKLGNQCDTPG